ncbi:MAG: hypothetical protein OEU54_16615 [Gemmatimonadota bacterium]|nr:hypothetical protein [Gemmatimonadota bacterium]
MKGIEVSGKVVSLALVVSSLAACGEDRATPQAEAAEVANAGFEAPAQSAPLLADTALARLMAEIQPAVERSSGLTATAPLNVTATDEGRLRAYLEQQLGTELPEEEEAALTATYARLGLVPADLDLRGLLSDLLQEQVVGYYDPKTDTLFVHDRVPADELAPVLAHELVHALQDQYVALDSSIAALGERSDALAAHQAAVEGHATFAMMEWQAGAMTGGEADLTQFPDLGPMLESLDLSQLGDFGSVDVLAAAPAVVREGLIFPYISGLVFLQRAWKSLEGRPLPLGDGLPESTEQVLHVEKWIERDSPTTVEFSESVASDWDEIRAMDLGEFETRLFLREHLSAAGHSIAIADEAAAGWDGDAYRLIRRGDDEVLIWASVWDSAADAEEFADAARLAYAGLYGDGSRSPSVERIDRGRPMVVIVDAPPGVRVDDGQLEVELSGN